MSKMSSPGEGKAAGIPNEAGVLQTPSMPANPHRFEGDKDVPTPMSKSGYLEATPGSSTPIGGVQSKGQGMTGGRGCGAAPGGVGMGGEAFDGKGKPGKPHGSRKGNKGY